MKVYWELSEKGEWFSSANAGISNRRRFSNVTAAVRAFVEAGGSCGLKYRLVRSDRVPLLTVDGDELQVAK